MLLAIPKRLTKRQVRQLLIGGNRKANRAFLEAMVKIRADGRRFELRVIRKVPKATVYSVELLYFDSRGRVYQMLRAGRKSNPRHNNRLELDAGRPDGVVHDCYRVNRITERYQRAGLREDGYAESASRLFQDLPGAIDTIAQLANIILPPSQLGFMEPEGEDGS